MIKVSDMFKNCFDCPFLSRYFKRIDYLFYKCSGEAFKKAKVHKDNLFIEPPDNCPYENKATD